MHYRIANGQLDDKTTAGFWQMMADEGLDVTDFLGSSILWSVELAPVDGDDTAYTISDAVHDGMCGRCVATLGLDILSLGIASGFSGVVSFTDNQTLIDSALDGWTKVLLMSLGDQILEIFTPDQEA